MSDRLHKAEFEFREDLERLENKVAKNGTIDAATRKSLSELNLELDFILSKVDLLSGDDEIRTLRKNLVSKFDGFAGRLDALLGSPAK